MELELVMQLHSQPRIIVSCFSVVPAKIEEERLCASTCSCIYKLCMDVLACCACNICHILWCSMVCKEGGQ